MSFIIGAGSILFYALMYVMAWLAQRLPVGAIPEQLLVALMRDDVIDYCSQ
jgi:hypothetical protein